MGGLAIYWGGSCLIACRLASLALFYVSIVKCESRVNKLSRH